VFVRISSVGGHWAIETRAVCGAGSPVGSAGDMQQALRYHACKTQKGVGGGHIIGYIGSVCARNRRLGA